ncbi:MAG: hypothetical protein GTO45_14945 [Candidatus Aminicenantes bacterium]|nr:hypothetical protein [Candidatus Aminicenantes bacterium]NIM80061.1 hypothetical protein [Candidatus Aminicenantes bacterium]NIN19404.1 hypothetical protein [Candidatus Aminicenantes bacterium]NIN43303.1 hypothetical protein [Candidatus Aminicenantes bacterium]NIN86047.1 hypothetical protein [Candidatus Aminicenantes bacterium]
MMLVYYLSMNIFAGDDFERIKELYFIERDRIKAVELNKKKAPEEERLQFKLHDRLKKSLLEIEFNTYCNDSDFENPDEIDFLEIAEKFHCDYDPDTNTYNRVKRGLLLFFFEKLEDMLESNDHAEGVIDTVLEKMTRINMFVSQQRNLVSDRTRLKEENQKLLRKIKKLNRDISALTLPPPKKKTPDRQEREINELKKKNYYLQSKIESLENRVAELEDEKKANKEIKENITINHENPVGEGLELQDFFSIVISGGHWNSRTREEVLEEFPHNEFIFVPADRTIRNIDTIENADLVIFDTSSHSHGYYYLVKKKASKLLHIAKSSPTEVKALFNKPTVKREKGTAQFY